METLNIYLIIIYNRIIQSAEEKEQQICDVKIISPNIKSFQAEAKMKKELAVSEYVLIISV